MIASCTSGFKGIKNLQLIEIAVRGLCGQATDKVSKVL